MNNARMTLVGTALFGLVALMLLMVHLLNMKPDQRAQGPVVEQLAARFSHLLAKAPTVVIREAVTPETTEDRTEEAQVAVILKLHPKSAEGLDRIVADISEFVWSSTFEGRSVRSVTAQWRDPGTGNFTAVRMKKPGKTRVLDLFTDLPVPAREAAAGAPSR